MRVDQITVGERARQEMGDIESLARSMKKLGLLQPIGVDPYGVLIFGGRRLAAAKAIGWQEIDAVVIDCDGLQAEHDENEIRKQFTVTERLAIAQRIAERMGGRQGQRTDLDANAAKLETGKTADIAARQSGFGSAETMARAQRAVEYGTPELVAAMDDGKVSIHAAATIATLPEEDQRIDYSDREKVRQAREKAKPKTKIHLVIEYEDAHQGAEDLANTLISRDAAFASELLHALSRHIRIGGA